MKQMRLHTMIKILQGLPKSIYLNVHYLGLRGLLKLPIIVSWRTQFIKLSGKVSFTEPLSFGMVRIGIGGSGTASKTPAKLELNGNLSFGRRVIIGGTLVTVKSDSHIIIGNNVQITGDTRILCADKIQIGDNSVISWDCQIMDTDFHHILIHNEITNQDRPVMIGNHCWIGSRCSITKGTVIPDNCIIASDSVIAKSPEQSYALYTGTPLRKLREGVDWEH